MIARRWSVAACCALSVVAGPTTGADEPREILPAPAAPASRYALRVPDDDVIAYHGVVDADRAGLGPTDMMYPAAGLAGLAAAVVAHGIVVSTMKAAQKRRLQNEADEILAPYEDTLVHFGQRDLLALSLPKIAAPGGMRMLTTDTAGAAVRVVDYAPTFAISQDGRAIVLVNEVAIAASGSTPAYRNTIRVVSEPETGDDPVAAWTANHGVRLKETSARLLAWSFDAALAEAAVGADERSDGPQKTIRYRLGAGERMERGTLVDEHCDRLLMRTLRGWLMSVPRVAPADDRRCEITAPR